MMETEVGEMQDHRPRAGGNLQKSERARKAFSRGTSRKSEALTLAR